MDAITLKSRLTHPRVFVFLNDSVREDPDIEIVIDKEVVAVIYGIAEAPYGLRCMRLERGPKSYDTEDEVVTKLNEYLNEYF